MQMENLKRCNEYVDQFQSKNMDRMVDDLRSVIGIIEMNLYLIDQNTSCEVTSIRLALDRLRNISTVLVGSQHMF